MANTITTIQSLRFNFLEKTTDVYVTMTSSEPDHPVWGNGVKYKSFPKDKSARDIMQDDVVDYLNWDYTCPTCSKGKYEPGTETCPNMFHYDPANNVLKMFEDNSTPFSNPNLT